MPVWTGPRLSKTGLLRTPVPVGTGPEKITAAGTGTGNGPEKITLPVPVPAQKIRTSSTSGRVVNIKGGRKLQFVTG